MKFSTVI